MKNEKLKILLPRIKRNVLLKDYTTFRIGGPAKYFFVAKTKKDLIGAIKIAKKFNLPFFVLGGGSNLLISDKGYKGLVINFQFSIFKFQNTKVVVGGGLPLGKLVKASVEAGLSGLEWAVGIPGTAGGAIYGNAEAFGKSIADVLKGVEVFDSKELRIKNYKSRDCKFGYRDSIFKHKKNLIILSAELQFKKGHKIEIKKKIGEYLKVRKETQPLNFPSAGSIFKNPRLRRGSGSQVKGFSAGELIEKCGLKGKRIGKAQISEKHANFIINLGQAKAKDVKKLIKLAKQKVKNKFGIILKEEIQLL